MYGRRERKIEAQVNPAIAEGVLAAALIAGWMDLRSRRNPELGNVSFFGDGTCFEYFFLSLGWIYGIAVRSPCRSGFIAAVHPYPQFGNG